jgi:hypothetical protein
MTGVTAVGVASLTGPALSPARRATAAPAAALPVSTSSAAGLVGAVDDVPAALLDAQVQIILANRQLSLMGSVLTQIVAGTAVGRYSPAPPAAPGAVNTTA